jgi:hypothetical protein
MGRLVAAEATIVPRDRKRIAIAGQGHSAGWLWMVI